MSSATSLSFQLPDLLRECQDIPLRTNRHCYSVTQASEKWLLGQDTTVCRNTAIPAAVISILSRDECARLKGMKVGLLSALCFPTCDASQLRVVTDLWTLIMYTNERVTNTNGRVAVESSSHIYAPAGDSLDNPLIWYFFFACLDSSFDHHHSV